MSIRFCLFLALYFIVLHVVHEYSILLVVVRGRYRVVGWKSSTLLYLNQIVLVSRVAAIQTLDKLKHDQVLNHQHDRAAHEMIHETNREPHVTAVIAAPNKSRVCCFRPHNKSDLHEPSALSEKK